MSYQTSEWLATSARFPAGPPLTPAQREQIKLLAEHAAMTYLEEQKEDR